MRHALVSAVCVAAVAGAATLALRAAGPITAVDAELQFQLGTILAGDTRYHEALDAFGRAATSPDRSLSQRALKWKVRTSLVVAEWGTALIDAERLVRELPDDVEAAVIEQVAALLSPTPTPRDELARALGLPIGTVAAALLELNLMGRAELLPGGLAATGSP